MNNDRLRTALNSALRFAGSRSAITAEDERGIWEVWNRATQPPLPEAQGDVEAGKLDETMFCGVCHGEFDAAEWRAATQCPECQSPKRGRRALPLPKAMQEEVEAVKEYETLITAGLSDYEAHCALRSSDDGVFCYAYLYSDKQWRFQTGGHDLVAGDGATLRCILTRALYAHPATRPEAGGKEAADKGEG